MDLQQRLETVNVAITKLFKRAEQLSKYNTCHNPSDGRFCSTSGGGTRASAPAPPPKAPAVAASSSGTSRKSHATKITGEAGEAATLLKEVDNMEKSFPGLSGFLEKYPVGELRIGKGPSDMRAADGLYVGGPKQQLLVVAPLKKIRNPDFADEGVTVAVDYAKGSKAAYQRAVFVHEMGHHVAMTVEQKSSGAFRKTTIIDPFISDQKKTSKYAGTHFQEYFAESFAAFHLRPKTLSKEAKQMVKNVMKRAKEI